MGIMSLCNIVLYLFELGGGTGFIGSHLTNLLNKSGFNVIAVSRMPGLNRITWHELTEKGIPNGIVAAVNVAGQNVLDPSRRWTPGFQQNVWNSRINTTAAIVQAISNSKNKPEIFVNISGVSLYPPDKDTIYTENYKGEDFDYMSKLCVHWEKAAEIAASESVRLVRKSILLNVCVWLSSTHYRYAFERES